jgi:hypothetical protein
MIARKVLLRIVFASVAPFAFLAGLDRRHWRWAGVAAAAAFSMAPYTILLDICQTSSLLVWIVSVAVVVAHANAMVRVPLAPNQRRLRWATVASAIIAAGFVDVGSITRPWQQEILGRLAGHRGGLRNARAPGTEWCARQRNGFRTVTPS